MTEAAETTAGHAVVLHEARVMRRQDVEGEFMAGIEPRFRLAKALVDSGMIPQRKPEAALAVMLKAFELGIPPMQAFASIHHFDGKLVMEAALLEAIAMERLGVRKTVLEWTDKVCRLQYTRPDHEPFVSEWTIEEAKTANLTGKDNWRKYPKDMLMARARARGIRNIAPDYFVGMLAREETDYRWGRDEPDPEDQAAIDALNARIPVPQQAHVLDEEPARDAPDHEPADDDEEPHEAETVPPANPPAPEPEPDLPPAAEAQPEEVLDAQRALLDAQIRFGKIAGIFSEERNELARFEAVAATGDIDTVKAALGVIHERMGKAKRPAEAEATEQSELGV